MSRKDGRRKVKAEIVLVEEHSVVVILGKRARFLEASSFRPRLNFSGKAVVVLEPRCTWTGAVYEEVTSVRRGNKSHFRSR